MKKQWGKGGRGIVLGDNTGSSWSGAIVLEFGFQLDFLVYMCKVHHMRADFQLVQNFSCAGSSGT
jgi:hypothetical protein